MSFPALLEVFASLTAQVTLLVGVAAVAICRRQDQADADGPWAAVHGCTLLITAAALLLPHLRLATLGDFLRSSSALAEPGYYELPGKLCLWIWLSGVAAVFVAVAGGAWRVAWILRHARPDDSLTQLVNQLDVAKRMGKRSPEVRVSQVSVSPFCWQFHRPVIVVPDLLLDIPPSEQAAVLKHELAHLTLRHPLHLFLQRLVEAIYWYNPLVWWSSRQAAAAREFRCDRQAIENRREVASYLRSLLTMIEAQTPPPGRLPAGLGFLGDHTLLQRRATTIAEYAHRPATSRWGPLVGAGLLAIAVGVFVWLPVNPLASRRAHWSPWPRWSAHTLDASGVTVRDYEIDGHRLQPHEHQIRRGSRPAE